MKQKKPAGKRTIDPGSDTRLIIVLGAALVLAILIIAAMMMTSLHF